MIRLSDHFTYKHLLRFTFPSIIMMVFTSIYGVVDGFFVSNFAGKTPFAAVNFIMPLLMILGCVGFMFGTGGSALIAKTMGEGDSEKANQIFSLIVYIAAACGVVLAVLGFVLLRPAAQAMGASGPLLENCILYGQIILAALPFFILQYEFQCLFAAAGIPKLGLFVTVLAGVANILLDGVFVAVFQWGLAGAAAATACSQLLGGVVPLLYFSRQNNSPLRLGKCRFDWQALVKVCVNGSSELMSNISASIIGMLYNIQLIKYAGENGIAAYGVLMYVSFIFQAIFIGYSVGGSPVIGYHYGAKNHAELRSLCRKSFVLISVFSILMFVAGEILAKPLALLFASYDAVLLEMTVHAFQIFSFSFLLSGFAIFGSAFFTALNDGGTSALISFLRTLVFQCAAILLFPLLLDLDGIWLSTVAAEALSVMVAALLLFGKRKKYHY